MRWGTVTVIAPTGAWNFENYRHYIVRGLLDIGPYLHLAVVLDNVSHTPNTGVGTATLSGAITLKPVTADKCDAINNPSRNPDGKEGWGYCIRLRTADDASVIKEIVGQLNKIDVDLKARLKAQDETIDQLKARLDALERARPVAARSTPRKTP